MKVCIFVFSPSVHTLHVSEKNEIIYDRKRYGGTTFKFNRKKEIFKGNLIVEKTV